jgi:divalent metal cation (Fe/Co/Zn/Cd) transporter
MKYFLRVVALLYFVAAIVLGLLGVMGAFFSSGAPNTTVADILVTVVGSLVMSAWLLYTARYARQVEESVAALGLIRILSPGVLLAIFIVVIELLPR